MTYGMNEKNVSLSPIINFSTNFKKNKSEEKKKKDWKRMLTK